MPRHTLLVPTGGRPCINKKSLSIPFQFNTKLFENPTMRLFTTLVLACAVSLASASCDADNCLRALRATQTPGRLQAAQSFCATFTKSAVPATAIPTFAAGACKQNQVGNLTFRVSSACGCIAASTTSITSIPSATGRACATVSSLAAVQRSASPSGKLIPPYFLGFTNFCSNTNCRC